MRVVQAASEALPFAKTGGLGDVVGALGKVLPVQGVETATFIPAYQGIKEKYKPKAVADFEIPLGTAPVPARILELPGSPRGQRMFFVENEAFFAREHFYGPPGGEYPDNPERFTFFCRSVLEACSRLKLKPDLFHAHDWHAALIPVLLALEGFDGGRRVPSVLTLHNLAFQGLFDPARLAALSLPPTLAEDRWLGFYGRVNLLKGGIVFADKITTVSPTYAAEIQASGEAGFGLEGLLKTRAADLSGILNGIDTEIWNPEKDSLIPTRYKASDLRGKASCKKSLIAEFKLGLGARAPLFGMVARLSEQKGLDLILPVMEELLAKEDLGLVMLGSGEPGLEKRARDLADRYPSKMSLRLGYDEGLAHRIEAGSDFFLMPSRFEPCGLNQMYSLRYGTPPVVRATGGLADTVQDCDSDPEGVGLSFGPYEQGAFKDAMVRALHLYQDSQRLRDVRQRGMARDHSWARAVEAYLNVYRSIAPNT